MIVVLPEDVLILPLAALASINFSVLVFTFLVSSVAEELLAEAAASVFSTSVEIISEFSVISLESSSTFLPPSNPFIYLLCLYY